MIKIKSSNKDGIRSLKWYKWGNGGRKGCGGEEIVSGSGNR